MSDDIKLKFTGTDDQLRRMLVAQQKEIEKLTRQTEEAGKASKKASDEARAARQQEMQQQREQAQKQREYARLQEKAAADLKREQEQLAASARKVAEAVQTPFERYKVKAAELREHLQQGRIDSETYRRALGKLATETKNLEADTEEARAAQAKQNAEMREAAQVMRRLETEADRVNRQVDTLNRLHRHGRITTEQYNQALRREAEQLHKVDTAARQSAGGFDKLRAGVSTTHMVAMQAIDLFGRMSQRLEQLRSEVVQGALQYDQLSRKLQIQANLTPEQRVVMANAVGGAAMRAGVDLQQAFAMQTQLQSSGFSDKSGKSLDAALALMQSSNAVGQDPQAFVQGLGQFLSAFGKDKTTDNLLELGIRMQGLFKSTDVQVGDLPQYAQFAGTAASQGVSLEDSLSAAAILREVMAPGQVGTGLKNITARLPGFGAQASQKQALESIGLTPDAVDLVGETLPQALGRMRQALDTVGQAEQAQVLTKLFGTENLAAAQQLLNNVPRFAEMADLQRSAAGQFQKDVQTARSGPAFEIAQLGVQKELDAAAAGELAVQDERRRRRREIMMNRLRNRYRERKATGEGGVTDDAVMLLLEGVDAANDLGTPFFGESAKWDDLNIGGPVGGPRRAGAPAVPEVFREMAKDMKRAAEAAEKTAAQQGPQRDSDIARKAAAIQLQSLSSEAP